MESSSISDCAQSNHPEEGPTTMKHHKPGNEIFSGQNSLETLEDMLAQHLKLSDDIPEKPDLLNNIGNIFVDHFASTHLENDINNSVLAFELAVQLLPNTDSRYVIFLNDYGVSLHKRYKLTEVETDIEQAISCQRDVVKLIPDDDVDFPLLLDNLASCLRSRFEISGDIADISEAISLTKRCIQLTPDGHLLLPKWLNNLGTSLQSLFDRMGDLQTLSDAILSYRKCIQATPEESEDLPTFLNNLGSSLQSQFERTGNLDNISEAIVLRRKSIRLTPEDSEDLPMLMNNLGSSLQSRFDHTGNPDDISEAILLQRKCIQITPEGRPDLPICFNNLGLSLQARFEYTGNMADISEAIVLQQKSIQLTPDGRAYLPKFLNNLGLLLQSHFKHTGSHADTLEAISLQRKCIKLTPEGHADLPMRLNNLGLSLQTYFERTRDLSIISEAALLQRRCIQLTRENHANLPMWLNNLGISLQKRFIDTRNVVDLSEAILLQQRCIQITPEDHANLPTWLNNLGKSLQLRFELEENLDDISEALLLQKKSIQLTPDGHANLPMWRNSLGSSLQSRFDFTADIADAQSAISQFRLSASSTTGPPSAKILGTHRWVQLAEQIDKSQLLDAYSTGIRLISQVAGLEKTFQGRYTDLANVSELSSSAAATAIDLGKYDLALEWLEQGRCIVWTQLNDLRSPIDKLREDYPDLADELIQTSRALENSWSRTELATHIEETSIKSRLSIKEEAFTHIKMAQEWEQLLVKVRSKPQFADFLSPISCSDLLKGIPKSGHVVVVNIHRNRSDALVLTYGATEPLHIALPKISYPMADTLRRNFQVFLRDSGILKREEEAVVTRGSRRSVPGIADVLKKLWTFVVRPILDGLEYLVPSPSLPRIWWCVTGPLAFLPIHAAGIYRPAATISGAAGTYTTLSEFAVSSYVPTARSLVDKTQRAQQIKSEKVGVLMISQPNTPKLPRIPGTTVEVEIITRILTEHKVPNLCLDRDNAQINRVKEKMDDYNCVHFACHASQNTSNPLQSGFYLHDGRLELSEIIKKNNLKADLAFLSACQTSTGDEQLSEEAVHLAGGMLAAGYRGVVATMWSIKDKYGPVFGEEFYKSLLNDETDSKMGSKRLGSSGAAHALHSATQQVRKNLDDSESSLLVWVPYVHFGI